MAHITYYPVSGDRKPFIPWLVSSFLFSAAGILLYVFKSNVRLLSIGSNKRSWLLIDALSKIKGTIHLVVAHNPGSFYPAQCFAQQNNISFGIDLEDYHPGETNDATASERMRRLNQAILPKADYISVASPLIASYSKEDLEAPPKKELLILNYFAADEFLAPQIKEAGTALTLVWFSQNISHGRGLEELIPVLQTIDDVALHLYGHMDEGFYETWLKGRNNIIVHAALAQAALHKELHKYDIGLALERPASNLNRDLCITNKILAYYQAGLYILASSTSAQDAFIQEHPDAGKICGLHQENLTATLRRMISGKMEIRAAAATRFEKARKHNWETASGTLLNTWNQVLS